jgi:hypothetical protein
MSTPIITSTITPIILSSPLFTTTQLLPISTTKIQGSLGNKTFQINSKFIFVIFIIFIACKTIVAVEFGNAFSVLATNLTLSACCEFCTDYPLCRAFTYYPMNKTCFLYDSDNLSTKDCKNCLSSKLCKSK